VQHPGKRRRRERGELERRLRGGEPVFIARPTRSSARARLVALAIGSSSSAVLLLARAMECPAVPKRSSNRRFT
jgi:hypothetical protein